MPAAAYLDHVAKMRALSDRFTPAVDTLISRFEDLVRGARTRLNGLFREEDYPSVAELRSKFSFETKVIPLPDANDFRVCLGDEEKERIKRQITASVEASLQVASRDLWQRLYEAVKHMADRLNAYRVTESGVEHPFRDTVVGNLVRLVEVLPKLNVTRDPELERLTAQVGASLVVDPKEFASVGIGAYRNRQGSQRNCGADGKLHGRGLRGHREGGPGGSMNHPTGPEWKLTRARTQLLLSQPFFGTLCLRLKMVAGSLPTMATDGRRIVYNPAFVESLAPKELEAVLAHEVMHCALGHHCRRGERDSQLWNEAADLAINPLLVANGFTLPKDALLDPAFYHLSAEEIYAQRLRNGTGSADAPQQSQPAPQPSAGTGGMGSPPQVGQQPGLSPPSPVPPNSSPNLIESVSGPAADSQTSLTGSEARPGGFGEVLDATDELGEAASPAEQSRQQREWSIAADQALRSAKTCGREPGSIERPLCESRESRQDWRAILRDFVAATTPSDYRWSPPNRRYIAAGLYLPSVSKSGVGEIVIAVDTSGSIGQEELAQFAGEITSICDEAKPEAIHVVYCDAAVQSVQSFESAEPIALKPNGGGGTDFKPVFAWVEQRHIAPVCLIYLTDLCCHSYPQVPEYPVLWVTDSRRRAPFGETIRVS